MDPARLAHRHRGAAGRRRARRRGLRDPVPGPPRHPGLGAGARAAAARLTGGQRRHRSARRARGGLTTAAAPLFPLLRGHWTPVLPLTGLTANPQAVEIAGERLVLFRNGEGRWSALLDRCPHRGAALSLGRVMHDGTLRCRYHGWRFTGDGACTKVPLNDLNPQALARIRAAAVPVQELAGALWVYTGVMGDEPPPPPGLPRSLEGPARQFGTYCQIWQTHWTRAVETFIDCPHPSNLHEQTIGSWTHRNDESGGRA
ncbi:MAG: Rieske 2Fe-2S domain-containing protein, partial [Gammaproteobacteria bacterium]|nr:Rieske 2Fe-2S domain-containing protein [Gammaproteobacteria bacterium]